MTTQLVTFHHCILSVIIPIKVCLCLIQCVFVVGWVDKKGVGECSFNLFVLYIFLIFYSFINPVNHIGLYFILKSATKIKFGLN